jgi:hypothetical protein
MHGIHVYLVDDHDVFAFLTSSLHVQPADTVVFFIFIC